MSQRNGDCFGAAELEPISSHSLVGKGGLKDMASFDAATFV